MRRGVRPRHLHEPRFVVRPGHSRDRAYLRIAQLTIAEALADQRKARQRVRDTHLLSRGDEIEPAMRIQPMRAAGHRLVAPRFHRVQFFDERKETIFGAMDVGAQRDDFATQRFRAHG